MIEFVRAIRVGESGVEFHSRHRVAQPSDMVPVRVRKAGVCETDLQLVKGYMSFAGTLGHEFIGVAESGKYAGQRVVGEINCGCMNCAFCHRNLINHCPRRTVIGILNHDGAFADVVMVPERNLHPVPDHVDDETAVFVEPLAAAFQIPSQLDLGCFVDALIIGDGRLGYLIAQVIKKMCTNVTVIGKHDKKLMRFEELGIDTEKLRPELSGQLSCDLAIDCSGSPSGIETALRFLRPGGTLVLKTTVAGNFEANLAAVVINEITVMGSRCGPFDQALSALAAGQVEVRSLITSRFPLERGVEALHKAAEKGEGKVLIEVS